MHSNFIWKEIFDVVKNIYERKEIIHVLSKLVAVSKVFSFQKEA